MILAAALLALPSLLASAPAAHAALEERIPRLMKEADVPGLSIALIEDGSVGWHRAFGVKDASTGAPVDDETVFEAASLSKPVFALVVLKLADAGVLDLDAPLSNVLPGYVDDPRLPKITARRVLTHTSGLPNWRPKDGALRIRFEPGARFSYSGEGFVYLQKAVEKITGKPLEALAKELVFAPLGMTSSSFAWRTEYDARKARGHGVAGSPKAPRGIPFPNAAASLHTTATDYARFAAFVLGGAGLKRATREAMLTPQVWVDEACQVCVDRPEGKRSTTVAWGLGWGLQKTPGDLAFFHWGDNNDEFHALVLVSPRTHAGLVVMANGGGGHSIFPLIAEAVLGARQPALDWLPYARSDSPELAWRRDVLAKGVSAVDDPRSRGLDEAKLNSAGYWLLAKNAVPAAVAVFERNVREHPDSWNAHDSLGEAYAAAGETAKAIASYERSVALNPANANGVEALKKLRAEPAPTAPPR